MNSRREKLLASPEFQELHNLISSLPADVQGRIFNICMRRCVAGLRRAIHHNVNRNLSSRSLYAQHCDD